jgi:hypothetical protein
MLWNCQGPGCCDSGIPLIFLDDAGANISLLSTVSPGSNKARNCTIFDHAFTSSYRVAQQGPGKLFNSLLASAFYLLCRVQPLRASSPAPGPPPSLLPPLHHHYINNMDAINSSICDRICTSCCGFTHSCLLCMLITTDSSFTKRASLSITMKWSFDSSMRKAWRSTPASSS